MGPVQQEITFAVYLSFTSSNAAQLELGGLGRHVTLFLFSIAGEAGMYTS